MIMIYRILILFISAAAVQLGCSSSPVAGSGSQTTNGVAVTIGKDSIYGVAQPGMSVELVGKNYNPIADSGYRSALFTGEDSLFAFAGLDSGVEYGLFAISSDSTQGVFISGLVISGDNDGFNAHYNLTRTGSVEGRVITQKEQQRAYSMVFFIPGSPFATRPDDSLVFSFDNLPPGNYRIKAGYFFDTVQLPRGDESDLEISIDKIDPGITIETEFDFE